MSDQETNIAIAKACGWSVMNRAMRYDGETIPFAVWTDTKGLVRNDCPNYCSDLNAMHEAERSLIFSKRQEYQRQVQKVASAGMDGVCLIAKLECIHATARQRAEAFLRTLGKWKE